MSGDVSTRLLMNTIGYVGQLAISLGENNNKSHDNKNYMSNCVSAQFPTSTAGNLPNLPISPGKIGVILFLHPSLVSSFSPLLPVVGITSLHSSHRIFKTSKNSMPYMTASFRL